MDKKIYRFGSRKSALALAQTKLAMEAVIAANPGCTAEVVAMDTTGDKNMKPFSEASDKFGIKGLFTQELEEALLAGEIDVAVHSLKDMPMNASPALPLVAWSKREDPRDVLVFREGLKELPEAPLIGCSSSRRRIQLAELIPDARIEPIRGNVNTRLRKLDEGQFDAIVLAAAGLKRLGLEGRADRYFEPDEMIPAPGQGIMVCQGRAGERYEWLAAFNDDDGQICAAAERAFSAELGGGCTSPVGAYAEVSGDRIKLRGLYADEERGITRRGTAEGPRGCAAELAAALARELKEERADG